MPCSRREISARTLASLACALGTPSPAATCFHALEAGGELGLGAHQGQLPLQRARRLGRPGPVGLAGPDELALQAGDGLLARHAQAARLDHQALQPLGAAGQLQQVALAAEGGLHVGDQRGVGDAAARRLGEGALQLAERAAHGQAGLGLGGREVLGQRPQARRGLLHAALAAQQGLGAARGLELLGRADEALGRGLDLGRLGDVEAAGLGGGVAGLGQRLVGAALHRVVEPVEQAQVQLVDAVGDAAAAGDAARHLADGQRGLQRGAVHLVSQDPVLVEGLGALRLALGDLGLQALVGVEGQARVQLLVGEVVRARLRLEVGLHREEGDLHLAGRGVGLREGQQALVGEHGLAAAGLEHLEEADGAAAVALLHHHGQRRHERLELLGAPARERIAALVAHGPGRVLDLGHGLLEHQRLGGGQALGLAQRRLHPRDHVLEAGFAGHAALAGAEVGERALHARDDLARAARAARELGLDRVDDVAGRGAHGGAVVEAVEAALDGHDGVEDLAGGVGLSRGELAALDAPAHLLAPLADELGVVLPLGARALAPRRDGVRHVVGELVEAGRAPAQRAQRVHGLARGLLGHAVGLHVALVRRAQAAEDVLGHLHAEHGVGHVQRGGDLAAGVEADDAEALHRGAQLGVQDGARELRVGDQRLGQVLARELADLVVDGELVAQARVVAHLHDLVEAHGVHAPEIALDRAHFLVQRLADALGAGLLRHDPDVAGLLRAPGPVEDALRQRRLGAAADERQLLSLVGVGVLVDAAGLVVLPHALGAALMDGALQRLVRREGRDGQPDGRGLPGHRGGVGALDAALQLQALAVDAQLVAALAALQRRRAQRRGLEPVGVADLARHDGDALAEQRVLGDLVHHGQREAGGLAGDLQAAADDVLARHADGPLPAGDALEVEDAAEHGPAGDAHEARVRGGHDVAHEAARREGGRRRGHVADALEGAGGQADVAQRGMEGVVGPDHAAGEALEGGVAGGGELGAGAVVEMRADGEARGDDARERGEGRLAAGRVDEAHAARVQVAAHEAVLHAGRDLRAGGVERDDAGLHVAGGLGHGAQRQRQHPRQGRGGGAQAAGVDEGRGRLRDAQGHAERAGDQGAGERQADRPGDEGGRGARPAVVLLHVRDLHAVGAQRGRDAHRVRDARVSARQAHLREAARGVGVHPDGGAARARHVAARDHLRHRVVLRELVRNALVVAAVPRAERAVDVAPELDAPVAEGPALAEGLAELAVAPALAALGGRQEGAGGHVHVEGVVGADLGELALGRGEPGLDEVEVAGVVRAQQLRAHVAEQALQGLQAAAQALALFRVRHAGARVERRGAQGLVEHLGVGRGGVQRVHLVADGVLLRGEHREAQPAQRVALVQAQGLDLLVRDGRPVLDEVHRLLEAQHRAVGALQVEAAVPQLAVRQLEDGPAAAAVHAGLAARGLGQLALHGVGVEVVALLADLAVQQAREQHEPVDAQRLGDVVVLVLQAPVLVLQHLDVVAPGLRDEAHLAGPVLVHQPLLLLQRAVVGEHALGVHAVRQALRVPELEARAVGQGDLVVGIGRALRLGAGQAGHVRLHARAPLVGALERVVAAARDDVAEALLELGHRAVHDLALGVIVGAGAAQAVDGRRHGLDGLGRVVAGAQRAVQRLAQRRQAPLIAQVGLEDVARAGDDAVLGEEGHRLGRADGGGSGRRRVGPGHGGDVREQQARDGQHGDGSAPEGLHGRARRGAHRQFSRGRPPCQGLKAPGKEGPGTQAV
jgi:hypothetical protein